MNIALIGDVHGKIYEYYDIVTGPLEGYNTIQLGDFGFLTQQLWFLQAMDVEKHKILFGNHDDYTFLDAEHSLGNFGYDEDTEIFWIRGAESRDKHMRIEGRDWWRNEELSTKEGWDCIDLYKSIKPKNVISHDCPQKIMENLFRYNESSSTRTLLQEIFEIHRPKNWFFGHHHQSIEKSIRGTCFRCLNELEYIII